jgi:hypothetical protein
MLFDTRYQGHKRYQNTGFWTVHYGPLLLIGRPCRDIHRAKCRANNYIESGRAKRRVEYLRP